MRRPHDRTADHDKSHQRPLVRWLVTPVNAGNELTVR
jgi:hypothetical protein